MGVCPLSEQRGQRENYKGKERPGKEIQREKEAFADSLQHKNSL